MGQICTADSRETKFLLRQLWNRKDAKTAKFHFETRSEILAPSLRSSRLCGSNALESSRFIPWEVAAWRG